MSVRLEPDVVSRTCIASTAAICDGRAAGQREAQRERAADADLAGHRDRSAQLLHDLLGDREAEAEAAALGRDEVVEDRLEPLGRNAAAGVGDLDDRRDRPARIVRTTMRPRGGVACNGVDDQVAVDPVQREQVAFDVDRSEHQLRGRA